MLTARHRPDPNADYSFAMNSGPDFMINVTHTLPRAAAAGPDDRAAAPYSVYDLLRDLVLLPQAAYYKERGLHPLPPDVGWLDKRPPGMTPQSSCASNAGDPDPAELDGTEPTQGSAETQPLDVLPSTVYREGEE